MYGEDQYVSDTILLEETFQALATFQPEGMEKHAFDLASILPSIGSAVSSATGQQFREEPDSVLRTVSDLLVPGIAFGIHPLLGVLVGIAEYFGFDLVSVYDKIKSAIMPSLEAGQPVSADQINSVAASAIPETQDSPKDEGNVNDLLAPLRAMRDKGHLTKEALYGICDNSLVIEGQLRGSGGNWFNPIKGLLSVWSSRKRNSIIVGLLSWFLKTILLSAGLLAVGGAVGHFFPKKPVSGLNTTVPVSGQQSGSWFSSSNIPESTGAGSFIYRTGPGDIWVEELNGMQPHEMVLDWAIKSFPSLYQYKNIILNTPSFWNVVRNVTEKWRSGQTEVVIPEPYKSRDDVVKLFIGDVFKRINEGRK